VDGLVVNVYKQTQGLRVDLVANAARYTAEEHSALYGRLRTLLAELARSGPADRVADLGRLGPPSAGMGRARSLIARRCPSCSRPR
jgi:hypothetical protein